MSDIKDLGVTGKTTLVNEMHTSYIAYAMSVITSRALPDVRDGMKPVHRRIVYAMQESGFFSNKPFRKSARAVGEVMGKYHPHGDSSIYEAMVRMAQTFNMSSVMIDGQGNFGSIDGDSPAAMRYTEARLSPYAEEVLTQNLSENAVDFKPNYDSSELEPKVLPARIPNILVNGGTGIAVGMANNIPTHNLGEVVDATIMVMKNPETTLDDIIKIMPGPDFPTGGVILGKNSIRTAYETGRGSIPLQSVYTIEVDKKGREQIIVTELPYALNKVSLITEIAEKVKNKIITGISDLRDESNLEGIRIVIEVKRDSSANLVLNHLLKRTRLLTSFGVNLTVIDHRGQPCVMNLIEILKSFIAFRRDCFFRRTLYKLNRARELLEIQIGLVAATTDIDNIVALIRSSSDKADALSKLRNIKFDTSKGLSELLFQINPDETPEDFFQLSAMQAEKIIDLKLNHLTSMEQGKLVQKAKDIYDEVGYLVRLLESQELMDAEIIGEMEHIRNNYSVPRRTIIEASGPGEINEDDLVEDKPVILTMTRLGYIKITAVDEYREQRRGGKGKSGMDPKDGDYVTTTMMCNARDTLLLFTSRGIAHTLKTYKIQEAGANARGRSIVNYGINLKPGESIATIMIMPNDCDDDAYMMFVTDKGDVRRNKMSDFSRINSNGKIAMKVEDDNGVQEASLINVLTCNEQEDLLLFTSQGKAIRFHVKDIRVFKGRSSQGIKGVTLGKENKVIGASILNEFKATTHERDAYLNGGTTTWDDNGNEQTLTLTKERMLEMENGEQTLITVTQKGFGKRFSSYALRTSGRGGQGVWVGNFGDTSGELVACFPVEKDESILLVTDGGQALRTNSKDIRVMNRNARGVNLFNFSDDQSVVDVARINKEDE